MQTVSVTREVAASREEIEGWMRDHEAFMRAAGFDEVRVEGDTVEIANALGIIRIELTLSEIDRPGAALAFEQREGIFEEMVTEYAIEEGDGSSRVTATTTFALDVALVGPIFDATVVTRQRRRELEMQLDHLAALAG